MTIKTKQHVAAVESSCSFIGAFFYVYDGDFVYKNDDGWVDDNVCSVIGVLILCCCIFSDDTMMKRWSFFDVVARFFLKFTFAK